MRGSIVQKKDRDTWYIVVDYYDNTGKRKRKWFSGYEKKRDAEKDLPRILKMMNENKYVETNGMTVKEFFEEQLKIQEHNLKQGTFKSYEKMFRIYLYPIYNVKLQNLQTIHIQNIYNDMLSGDLNGKELSPKTIYNFHGYVHIVLDSALKLGLIATNPSDALILPKKRKFDIDPLSKMEMDLILNNSKDKPYYLGLLLAMTTGMRKGEILGLEYNDIDLVNGIINVRRSRQRYGIDTLKTESSKRQIAISDFIINAINENIKIQKQYKDDLDNLYQDNDFLIKDFDGNLKHYDWLNNGLNEQLEELNIRHVRFHDLRHSHATYLVSNGVNMKIVQDRLGHSTIATTANIYSHPNVDAQRNALKGLF